MESTQKLQPAYQHVAEMEALCSPRVRQLIQAAGIIVTNFGELVR